MNVLSLFDGMSCGQQALERVGIKVDNYYASEIDKYAIEVTMANYPNTIQLGSVVDVSGKDLPNIDLLMGGSPCQSFSFAGKRKGMSTKDNQEILTLEYYLQLKEEGYEFEGQSYLFWEYMRLLNETQPKYFLLENVMMSKKWQAVLSKAIGVEPIMINSALLSAQNRKRLYWTNIGMEPQGLLGEMQSIIKQPQDKGILLKDVLESEVDEKYFLSEKMHDWLSKHSAKRGSSIKTKEGEDKASCLTSTALMKGNLSTDYVVHNMQKRSADRPSIQKNKNAGGSGHLSKSDGKTYCLDTANTQAIEILDCYNNNFRSDGKTGTITQHMSRSGMTNGFKIVGNNYIRKLTPVECERLQTVKDNYTNHVSDSQRYKMLGNGWTVDVIAHIFKHLNK